MVTSRTSELLIPSSSSIVALLACIAPCKLFSEISIGPRAAFAAVASSSSMVRGTADFWRGSRRMWLSPWISSAVAALACFSFSTSSHTSSTMLLSTTAEQMCFSSEARSGSRRMNPSIASSSVPGSAACSAAAITRCRPVPLSHEATVHLSVCCSALAGKVITSPALPTAATAATAAGEVTNAPADMPSFATLWSSFPVNSSAVIGVENIVNVPPTAFSCPSTVVVAQQSDRVTTLKPNSYAWRIVDSTQQLVRKPASTTFSIL
mmetsp:Transcript_62633/g.165743  ORF Transcript_62633/g.165743 Transcript_62633/m.165743 type:complete len:265 (+) Transcript_62633:138-932(+)